MQEATYGGTHSTKGGSSMSMSMTIPSVTAEDWISWKDDVMQVAVTGDLASTAINLAMCLSDGEDDLSLWGERNLFSDPIFRGNHLALWNEMAPNITPEFLPGIWYRLQDYGWEICENALAYTSSS